MIDSAQRSIWQMSWRRCTKYAEARQAICELLLQSRSWRAVICLLTLVWQLMCYTIVGKLTPPPVRLPRCLSRRIEHRCYSFLSLVVVRRLSGIGATLLPDVSYGWADWRKNDETKNGGAEGMKKEEEKMGGRIDARAIRSCLLR